MDKNQRKRKLKKIYSFFIIYYVVIYLCIVFPPIIKIFDRTDIWIGAFPLSEVYILTIVALIVIGSIILYLLDSKYSTKKMRE